MKLCSVVVVILNVMSIYFMWINSCVVFDLFKSFLSLVDILFIDEGCWLGLGFR